MRWDCDAAREHIDAGALSALDEYETRALQQHLAGCAECAALAEEAGKTAAAVGLAVPLRASSAALKSRVMASAAVLRDIRDARVSRWWPSVVAAALVIGVGAVAWGTVSQMLVNDLEGENAELVSAMTAQSGDFVTLGAGAGRANAVKTASAAQTAVAQHAAERDRAIDLVVQPDLVGTDMRGTAQAPAATGRCLWSRAQAIGAFVAKNLPRPPSGKAYQLWVVYSEAWLSGGVFSVDGDGGAHLIMNKLGTEASGVGAFEGFAVTLEPSGGADERTGSVVMQSTP